MTHQQQAENEADSIKKTAMAPSGAPEAGRKKFCGAWSLQGTRKAGSVSNQGLQRAVPTASAPSRKYLRLRCKCWGCSLCAPRKANKYRGQILRAVVREKLNRFLTLTLDAKKIACGNDLKTYLAHFEIQKAIGTACRCETCTRIQCKSVKHIRKCWNKLRIYFNRRFGVTPKFVAVLEFQKTTGLAHLHIVIDHYIDQAWAKAAWSSVGGGEHVDIRFVDAHRVAPYVSKYLSKEMLLDAPLGTRRVTTSRSIKLDMKKPSEYSWMISKSPISRIHLYFREWAADEVLVEGELESFSVRE
ncbi:MAG: hypothetical protein P4L51_03300 [Puia sp.]|nr:hypothetical protein [Puia sp.]